ncbi:unnamed protein product [Brassica oleracea var. botrytis]|uniref:Uncharacterized protein n=1 Tax=Brassica oleracea TaxID=3712 RepID=A0A3P6BRS4_BRAOL|nr:unnamed protein product [Brassica oleracea]
MRSPKLLLNDKEEEEVSGDELGSDFFSDGDGDGEEKDDDGDEEEDTEPLADDFLDGRDEEEGTLGSDSDSDLEKEIVRVLSNFKDLRSEEVNLLNSLRLILVLITAG